MKVTMRIYGYHSSSEKEYEGSLAELVAGPLKRYLNGVKPKTENGLRRALNAYAKKNETTYTGCYFDIC